MSRWIRVKSPPTPKETIGDKVRFFKYSISGKLLFLVPTKYHIGWLRFWGQGEFYWDPISIENDGTIFQPDEKEKE